MLLTDLCFALLFFVIGGILNRWRGGFEFKSPNKFLTMIDNLPHQVKRAVMTLLMTCALLLPQDVSYLVWLLCFASIFVLGFVCGWGSWFFIGRASETWKHNQDAIWAEYISYWVYGPKWIPNPSGLPTEEEAAQLKKLSNVESVTEAALLKRFNIIKSPTGEIRPLLWRVKMEKFAMCIRGLGFTLPVSLILLVNSSIVGSTNLSYLIIAPLGYSLGYLYEAWFFLPKSIGDKIPNGCGSTSTQLGEILTGVIFSGGMYVLSKLSVAIPFLLT